MNNLKKLAFEVKCSFSVHILLLYSQIVTELVKSKY